MAGDGRWIEIQATAENKPFSDADYMAITGLARRGIAEIFQLWK